MTNFFEFCTEHYFSILFFGVVMFVVVGALALCFKNAPIVDEEYMNEREKRLFDQLKREKEMTQERRGLETEKK